jgi:GNAT superfamily N-acetyltransferase
MKPETSPDVAAGCRLVEWDSEFFDRRIARIEPAHLVAAGMRAVEEWCADQRIDCVHLLAGVDDQPACEMAQANGFRLVDVRVTLETMAMALPREARRIDVPAVRPARADDVELLKAIARESHRDTRFYVDGKFDHHRCDQLYELWIARSCNGWADRVFVAEVDGSPVGYMTCHLHARSGRIGLVAVRAASRGRGAGSALIDCARQWFQQEGADRVSVVTQARNAAGLRLYQRAGLTVRAIELWFHKWL